MMKLNADRRLETLSMGVVTLMQYPPAAIIWGPEDYLVDIKVTKILDSMNQQDGDGPEVIKLDGDETESSVLDECLAEVPLFAQRRVIVIKHPKWLGEAKTKKGKGLKDIEPVLVSFLENSGSETHLIMTSETAPQDNAVVKLIKQQGSIEEVPALSQRDIMAWLEAEIDRRGSKIDRNAVNILAGSGQNMYSVVNEIERLTLCYPGQLITAEQLFDVAIDAPDTNIFKLMDALIKRRCSDALLALNVLLAKGEPVPLIIHMLTREYVLLGKVQALRKNGMTSQEIAKKLGQKPFRIDKMMQAGMRDEGKLPLIFNLLSEVDRAIKRTGQDERVLLESLMIDICQ